MKTAYVLVLALLLGCSQKQSDGYDVSDAAVIKKRIHDYHEALASAYNGAPISTDSLLDAYFDPEVYYVTYWGTAEPIDTTKTRFRNAVKFLKEYEYSTENLTVKSYGNGAYTFFVLRQSYALYGQLMDEYLPTTWVWEKRHGIWKVVHAQRCADLPTIQQLFDAARRREQEQKPAGEK